VSGPEAVFGSAARLEGGNFVVAGVVPPQQLKGGGIGLAVVQVLEKRGSCEPPGAKIEDKVHEGIELTLRERNGDLSCDRLFSGTNVPEEDDVGLGQADAVGIALVGFESMAVADGRVAGDIEVDFGAEGPRASLIGQWFKGLRALALSVPQFLRLVFLRWTIPRGEVR
jgi:hypothetical protein